MHAKTLKLIAIGLVTLSLALAVAGFRLSRDTRGSSITHNTQPADQTRQRAVITSRELAPGDVLQAADLAIATLPFAVENTFADSAPLIGRTVYRALRKGAMLDEEVFRKGGALVQETAPGQRAVAIRIDETSGAGGFLRPGDRVDVFYTLHTSGANGARSLAGTLVRNARLLAFGSDLADNGAPREKGDDGGKRSRSAVLEVSPTDVSRLLLAETNGVLRLAAIGAREGLADAARPGPLRPENTHAAFVTLTDISDIGATRRRSESVEIFQGDVLRVTGVNSAQQEQSHRGF